MTKGVVVGAGINGLSVAYNLAKRGADVTVVEAGYPGRGASGRGPGGVRCQWENREEIVLAREGRKIFEGLSAELGSNVLFRQKGSLVIAEDEETFRALKRNAKLQDSLGVKTSTMDAGQIGEMLPFMNTSGVVGGTYVRKDGLCDTFSLLFAYLHALKGQGGKLLKSTEATRIITGENGARGVVTSGGQIDADFVVVAAGVQSRDLLNMVGIRVPSRPFKMEVLATESLKPFLKPMIFILPRTLFLTQTLRGEIITWIDAQEHIDRRDIRSSLGFLESISVELVKTFPAFSSIKVLRPWAATCELSQDGKPIYGETGVENLYVMCADSGRGFTFAPITGRLMADLILDGKMSDMLSPFQLSRFPS